jgi:hypothetical protein
LVLSQEREPWPLSGQYQQIGDRLFPLFEHAGIEDAEVPGFLRQIDEALLPWVHLEDRTLTFTVVRGHVVGDFQPDKGAAGSGTP